MLNQSCNHDLNKASAATSMVGILHDKERLVEMSKKEVKSGEETFSGREKLTRHQMEMGGRVWIPDVWGHESYLKEWVDCSAFDSSLVPEGVVTARQALLRECQRANSGGIRIDNRC